MRIFRWVKREELAAVGVDIDEKDYHSDYFKEALSEQTQPVKLTLVGKEKNNQPEPPQEEEIPGFLNKDETMIQVSDEYRAYSVAYKLPKLTITNNEWDILFDTIYHKLEESSQEERLYEYMSFLQRYVISYALVHNEKEISFHSYIEQIPRIEFLGIKKEDIKDIVKKLNQNKKPAKILKVDFKPKRNNK